ncbi:MAG: twin-arginine translocase subunit TatB [Rhodospirillaceae bacterium]|nr:twin-arginine translocase subunit TatB [Rhodospirillaceae bacterium]
MLDVSWQEIMVIAAVAVVVIGPKDLPNAIRTVASWVKKAREMAGEFQRGVDEMVREAELADVRKQVEQTATGLVDDVTKIADNAIGDVKKSVDPTGEIEAALQAPQTFAEPVVSSTEPLGPPSPVAPVETASLPTTPTETVPPPGAETVAPAEPAAPKPPAAA